MQGACAPERENVEPQLDDKNGCEKVLRYMVDVVKYASSKCWALCLDEAETEIQNNENPDTLLY